MMPWLFRRRDAAVVNGASANHKRQLLFELLRLHDLGRWRCAQLQRHFIPKLDA